MKFLTKVVPLIHNLTATNANMAKCLIGTVKACLVHANAGLLAFLREISLVPSASRDGYNRYFRVLVARKQVPMVVPLFSKIPTNGAYGDGLGAELFSLMSGVDGATP
jgi:hypothetical protein